LDWNKKENRHEFKHSRPDKFDSSICNRIPHAFSGYIIPAGCIGQVVDYRRDQSAAAVRQGIL
jgi:hypothetical protein